MISPVGRRTELLGIAVLTAGPSLFAFAGAVACDIALVPRGDLWTRVASRSGN